MSLLQEIQDAAISADSDLGEVLRRCKLLASRLQSRPLADWLLWEANGYPLDVDVPEYRQWVLPLEADFNGPWGSQYKNWPIPIRALPEAARKLAQHQCRDSISDIGQRVAELQSDRKGRLGIPLTNFVSLLHHAI